MCRITKSNSRMRSSSSVAEGPITTEMLQDGLQILEEVQFLMRNFQLLMFLNCRCQFDYATKPTSSICKYEMYTVKIPVLHTEVLFPSLCFCRRQLTALNTCRTTEFYSRIRIIYNSYLINTIYTLSHSTQEPRH